MSERLLLLTPAAVLDALSRAVVTTDTDGTILYWNRGAELLYGWAPEEVVGRSVIEVLVPDAEVSEVGSMLDRVARGETWSGEFWTRHKDGRTLRVAVTESAVVDDTGRAVAVVGESEDLSTERRLESEVRATRDEQRLAHAEVAATRLRGLESVTMSLLRAVDAPSVARAVLDEGVPAVGGRTGSICLVAEDDTTVEIVHEIGYRDEVKEHWASFPLDAALPASEAIRTGELVLINGRADRDARYPAFRGVPLVSDQAYAVAPLVDEDGVPFGAMVVGFPEQKEFNEGERRVLSALAAQAATALRRAALYEETREAVAAEREARVAAERAQERLAFLARASSDFASSVLDLDSTLVRVVELAVPRLADGCAIHLVDERGNAAVAAATHVDPSKVAALRVPADVLDAAGVGAVIRTGRSEIHQNLPGEVPAVPPGNGDPTCDATTILPLLSQGRPVGALTLVTEPGRCMGDADLQLAVQLTVQAAVAIENARLFADRTRVARALQASLLPPILPAIPGLQLGARYAPAGEGVEVGGDFYDAFAVEGGRWLLVVGDVRGKGVDAAAITGLARHTIRSIALYESRPSAILAQLNRVLLAAESDRVAALATGVDPPWELTEPRFCTVAVAIVEPGPGGAEVVVCSGGHPLPLVARTDGRVDTAGRAGSLLGAVADIELHDVALQLHPGDSLVCFTDGIVERHQGRLFFDDAGLADVLAGMAGTAVTAGTGGSAGMDAATMAARVEQEARNLFPDSPQDDMAVLVLRVPR
jgi:PAS domain S-box-containing protein